MNRNFRTMEKAKAYRLAQLDRKIDKAIDDACCVRYWDMPMEWAQDQDCLVTWKDFSAKVESAIEESVERGSLDQYVQACVDDLDLDRWAHGFLADNVEGYVEDVMMDQGIVTSDDLDRAFQDSDFITEDDLYERVGECLDNQDYVKAEDLEDLIDESECMVQTSIDLERLEAKVAELELKVKMLEVLAGLESVKA